MVSTLSLLGKAAAYQPVKLQVLKGSRLSTSCTHRLYQSSTQLKMAEDESTYVAPIPRAAVSTCVHCLVENQGNPSASFYLLVQRGKAPNKGMWSLPGGKIEYGETALQGAIRELTEEVQFENEDLRWKDIVKWYPFPVTTSDSIGDGFHYLIAQCYADFKLVNSEGGGDSRSLLPKLIACDDAAGAEWFTIGDIQDMVIKMDGGTTPGVLRVIQRIQEFANAGLLKTSKVE